MRRCKFIHSNLISCSLIGSLLNTRSVLKMSTKDSGREGPACRVISCRMERGMNYCVYAHLRQLIAISRHFWSVLKRSRHAASESHADMPDAAEFNMFVSKFLTRQKAKTKQSKAKENKSNTNKTKHLVTKQNKIKQ